MRERETLSDHKGAVRDGLNALKTPLVVGGCVYLYLTLLIAFLLFNAPPWLVLLLFVPVTVAVAVGFWLARRRRWQTLVVERTVFILQSFAGIFLGKPIASHLLATALKSFELRAGKHDSFAFQLLLTFSESSGWVDIFLILIGATFLVLAVFIAERSTRSDPTDMLSEVAPHAPANESLPRQEVVFLSEVPPLDPVQIRKALTFRSYDSDIPPEVKVWIGRADQLKLVEEISAGVIVLTGIGGQGKSALAAKALEHWRARRPNEFWDWRDCREEGDRFPTQLAAIMSRITLDALDVTSLANSNPDDTARLFFRLTQDAEGLLVFDNVDQYVNVDEATFSAPLDSFINQALRTRTKFKIILTCRPHISYADYSFREIPLVGLSESETIRLFRARNIPSSKATDDQLKEIHRLTRGHPFWLTILASELHRKSNIASTIIAQLREGSTEDDRIAPMLRPIWRTLNKRERDVLSVLSECSRPINESMVERLLSLEDGALHKLSRAFRAVVAMGLVSRKAIAGQVPLYELHPVVRQYLRSELGFSERKPFIDRLADFTKEYVVRVQKSQGLSVLSFETFEFAAVNLESLVNAGRADDASRAAVDVSQQFVSRGLIQEYVRLGETILNAFPWEKLSGTDPKQLHKFVKDMVERLVEVGRESAARDLIKKYNYWTPADTPSRIDWYSKLCRIEWLLGHFEEAVKFGRLGVSIKDSSDIDTSSDAAHNLNLALRDAGYVDEALEFFIKGSSIDDVTRLEETKEDKGAPFYGNIGRCLYLQGRIDDAMRCYARAWQSLKRDRDRNAIENRGWAGLWLGEAFNAKGDHQNAAIFLAYARNTWTTRLPMKIPAVMKEASASGNVITLPPHGESRVTEQLCNESVDRLLKKI